MARVFASLALGNIVVLLLTATFGLLAQSVHSADRHVALAVFTLLVSCVVQVAAVTYLSVTSKLVFQAVHLGGLDPEPVERIRRFKRSTMHAVGLVVVGMLLITATGAINWRAGGIGSWHLAAAGLGFACHLIALYRQHGLIVENAQLVGEVLSSYSELAVFGGPRTVRSVKSRDVTDDAGDAVDP